MKRTKIFGGLLILALTANAQSYKEEYVDWGAFAKDFGETLYNWEPGDQVTEDDNFFISRVKPRERFRNEATQVRTNITEKNDKKILFWVPINEGIGNALPDGKFDSEVFNMWQYITIYGNWSAPQGRIPGNFADVAHKNGVSVSSVAGIPWGGLYGTGWDDAMSDVVDCGAQKTADFLNYYGYDGLGYNSEFSGGYSIMNKLIPFHKELTQIASEYNPVFNNCWYDGTNEQGSISFDQGYGGHNDDISDGAKLFFNYNWNSSTLLSSSVSYAENRGYDPLDLFAGCNMQGAEPGYNSWPLLQQYNISIGLWGEHSRNMFWESRGEKGGSPDTRQRTYQQRLERWFTGGTRNPVNCPAVTSSMKYNADNYTFHGMSTFMTAKSTLSWDLAEEPFVTYFNLGNGKFFNWMGERQHDGEWYNIGVQDYLPTWRWWFTKTLLGRTEAEVAEGLDAEFTWDDAYVGGSTVRIFGSTNEETYLHLFKTKYEVKDGDVITFRYKLAYGSAEMSLVLTATGAESTSLGDLSLCTSDQLNDDEEWIEKSFVVGEDIEASEIALVALKFKNAKDANIYLGEFSIVRGEYETPDYPEIDNYSILSYGPHGVDAKIIFNMANDKEDGEPCYNIDVNTSMFKLYAQQQGCEPVLMGITTSWAGLMYNIPIELVSGAVKVRLGVSAVSLDTKSESDIEWTSYVNVPEYNYNDDIQINKNTIKPNEDFEISFVDPMHEPGVWTITDAENNEIMTAEGIGISVPEGLEETGNYNISVKSYFYNNDRTARNEETRTFLNYIQVSSESVGALPKIYTLTANGEEADITIAPNAAVQMAYTGRKADGNASQGVDLEEKRFGVKCADIGIVGQRTFSVAFWIKINELAAGETQLLCVANKTDAWPKTDWGWLWFDLKADGSIANCTFRGTDGSSNNELRYKYANSKVPVGGWAHLAFVFEYSGTGFRSSFYINGKKQELTGWNRATNGDTYYSSDPGYQQNVYSITNGQLLSIGGSAHSRNGISGTVDNVQVWDKAMTDADVLYAMGDVDPNNLDENITAYWDFENAAEEDYTFKSVGGKVANVSAGIHDYVASGGEGQGILTWLEPKYTSGSPFVSGTAYPVTTVPSWKTKKAIIENVTGNDVAGSATVKYPYGGDYTVTLTLENSLGSDQRTFQVIKVDASLGIENVENAELTAYAIDGVAIVEFAKEGNYNVTLYNVAGQKIAGKSATVAANDKMNIAISNKGTYVLVIEQDGKTVRSVKLYNK